MAFRLGALFGLRRSEVLALRWDDVDVEAKSLRIDESLVATNEGAAWSNAKNERSRRVIPLDDGNLLGHSPEMLMNTYTHVLPQSQTAVVDRISRRNT